MDPRRRRNVIIASLVLAAGSVWAGGVASAQPADTRPARQSGPGADQATDQGTGQAAGQAPSTATQRTSLDTALSNAFFRLARFDLLAQGEPISADYRIATIMLRQAERYSPEDVELVRRRIEAGWAGGDTGEIIAATERLVKLDPRDTVALLRLIGARINAIQTVEERLAAFEQFLGERGRSIDASVRSRLALDAALLCRERRDTQRFAQYLTQATQLDGTNKDAALLAYTYLSERVSDPAAQFELLANLLYADPMDPQVHLMIRDELAAVGAFGQARRFHLIARGILASVQTPDRNAAAESLVLDWRAQGATTPLDSIEEQLKQQRDMARYQNQLREQAGDAAPPLPPGQSPQSPDDIRLDLEFERVRLAASSSANRPESLDASLSDLKATIDGYISAFSDPAQRGEVTQEQADSIIAALRLDVALWTLFVDRASPELAASLPAPETAPEQSRGDAHAVLGWSALRAGEIDRAAQHFGAAPETNPWAEIGLAEVDAKRGETAAAVRRLERIGANAPLSPLAAWASDRAEALRGGPAPVSAVRRTLEAEAAKVPGWIDLMTQRPESFQQFTVNLEDSRSPALGRAMVRIRVRNTSPIPLALGTDRTINTRVVLSPNLELIDRRLQTLATAEVAELDRRLRLLPGESLEVMSWADAGLTGWLTEIASTAPSRIRWRALQGYQAGGTSISQRPGPGSMEASTATHVRLPLPESSLPTAELADLLGRATGDELAAAIAAVRTKLLFDVAVASDPAAAAQERTQIAQAAARLYPTWPAPIRTLAAAILPNAASAPEAAAIDEAVRGEADPRVLFAALMTRPAGVDDPLIVAALGSEDASLRELAELQRRRIEAGRATLATVRDSTAPSGPSQ